jgi:hypothetical protein
VPRAETALRDSNFHGLESGCSAPENLSGTSSLKRNRFAYLGIKAKAEYKAAAKEMYAAIGDAGTRRLLPEAVLRPRPDVGAGLRDPAEQIIINKNR